MAENIRETIYKSVRSEITPDSGKANLLTVSSGTYKIFMEFESESGTVFSGDFIFSSELSEVIDFNINFMGETSFPKLYKSTSGDLTSLIVECSTDITKIVYKTEIYFGNINSFGGTVPTSLTSLSLKKKSYSTGMVITDLQGTMSWEFAFDESTGSLVLSKK